MTTIVFSDGVSFRTDGPVRMVRKPDGLYVVGQHMLIPVNSEQEAQEIISDFAKQTERRSL